jgi:hypothetical protein
LKSEELREKSEKWRISRFAKHWQIHPPRGFQFLPNIGKIKGKLPSIGKTFRPTPAAP